MACSTLQSQEILKQTTLPYSQDNFMICKTVAAEIPSKEIVNSLYQK